MAFKQSNNPLSRKTSPMRRSPFRREETMSMKDLEKQAAQEDAQSKAQALKLPQIEKPGFDYEMDQDMSYPGGERGRDYDEEGMNDDGMSRKESPLNVEGGKSAHTKSTSQKADFAWETHKQGSHHKVKLGQKTPKPSEEEIAAMSEENSKGVSRKESPLNMESENQEAVYFGLGEDDGTGRKIKKANKTAAQIAKMQNKRSSVKNVYLGDPDDLEGEMVRTADKPASKREVRKIKKFKKTKNQLDSQPVKKKGLSRKSSPLNVDFSEAPKNNTPERRQWYTDNNLAQDETTKLRKKPVATAVSTIEASKDNVSSLSANELSDKIKKDIDLQKKKQDNPKATKTVDKNSKATAIRAKAEKAQDGSIRGGEKANRLRKRYDRVNKRQEKKDARQEKRTKKFTSQEEKSPVIKDVANPTASTS